MRHRWSLIAVGAYVSAIGAAHCSFTNDLDSLGAGSPDAGNTADSRVDTKDTSTPSQGSDGDVTDDTGSLADTGDVVDGATIDTSTPGDGDVEADAAEAGPTNDPPYYGDSGATHYCDGHTSATFCADFDEGPLPSGFTSSEGAYLALTSTLPSSKANDLLLLVPPQPGAGTLSSKLSRSFTQTSTSVVLAFDFYPENVNTTPSGILFTALDFLGNSNAKFSVRVAYNQGATRIEESYLGFPTDIFHPSFNLTPGQWSRVKVELTFGVDGGPSTLATYVNDVLQGAKEALNPPTNVDTRPSLLVGAVYGTLPHNGWTFRYDNVTLDLH